MTILFGPQGTFGWFSYTTSRDTIGDLTSLGLGKQFLMSMLDDPQEGLGSITREDPAADRRFTQGVLEWLNGDALAATIWLWTPVLLHFGDARHQRRKIATACKKSNEIHSALRCANCFPRGAYYIP
ncbi:hypothetical protein [Pseudomonas putida]|uniref:hypothetical protein n=1 Tax=Pseudomonas putida TaxID=303 RepID=UPI000BF0546F|nr:hypothetical protein [Pseudomonas putida]PEI10174.1 hypothetical protein CRM86_20680 [Pseudomonas putida]